MRTRVPKMIKSNRKSESVEYNHQGHFVSGVRSWDKGWNMSERANLKENPLRWALKRSADSRAVREKHNIVIGVRSRVLPEVH
jgi:hypothetical protein